MVRFDDAHKAVHYPPDRRFRIWVRPSVLIGVGIAILSVIAAAWIEVAVAGMPRVPAVPQIYPNNFAGPHGFPVWVRYCHFFNFLFVMMLIRSGLSILMDHPRLYFNDGSAEKQPKYKAWIGWPTQQADRADPFVSEKPPSVLDRKNELRRW